MQWVFPGGAFGERWAGFGVIWCYLLSTSKVNAMPVQRGAATTLSVKLDGAMRGRIRNLAEIRQRTAHWLVREAIAQYVEREEKREAFRQATLAAWQEYQETGLHATGEEVDAWLASWGAESELAAPVCHK